jgi:ABC-type antimicrobial peptide transport system permease subunit
VTKKGFVMGVFIGLVGIFIGLFLNWAFGLLLFFAGWLIHRSARQSAETRHINESILYELKKQNYQKDLEAYQEKKK